MRLDPTVNALDLVRRLRQRIVGAVRRRRDDQARHLEAFAHSFGPLPATSNLDAAMFDLGYPVDDEQGASTQSGYRDKPFEFS